MESGAGPPAAARPAGAGPGGRLIALVMSTTALSLASYGAYAWTARRAFPELRLRTSLFSRALVREVTTFSAYFFILDMVALLGYGTYRMIFSHLPVEHVHKAGMVPFGARKKP